MAHCREKLRLGVSSARDLLVLRHGARVRIAGCVIARHRPGTAHGFIFLSIEDETSNSNAIIEPELYERHRALVTYARTLVVRGPAFFSPSQTRVSWKEFMPVMVTKAFWFEHRIAILSVAFCVCEVVIVWGVFAIVYLSSTRTIPHILISTASAAWLLGSIASMTFAALAIVFDSRKREGLLALLIAFCTFLVCGLPMLV